MKMIRRRNKFLRYLTAVAVVLLLFYSTQRFWAHRTGYFIPDYPQVALTENTDCETIFLQTGLGRPVAEKLLAAGEFQTILDAQEAFFHPPKAACTPLLGWFTREDRFIERSGFPPVDLQPGDILLTLSTHTAGWRHGHAALVIDEENTLESIVLGTDSAVVNAAHWSSYSNYAVLRIKNVTPELQKQVVQYSKVHLQAVPYRLTSGWIGPKAPLPEDPQFGLHCSYLVWYAWNRFGYDLDSDGGRLVSAHDLLQSNLLEIVQIFGMDPRNFLIQTGGNHNENLIFIRKSRRLHQLCKCF